MRIDHEVGLPSKMFATGLKGSKDRQDCWNSIFEAKQKKSVTPPPTKDPEIKPSGINCMS